MRRLLLGPLAVCALAACLSVPARADDVPYAGTWKVTILDQAIEMTALLLEIRKDGKSAKLIDGLKLEQLDFSQTKVAEVKGDAKTFRAQLALPNGTSFGLVAYPGKAKDKMTGSIRTQLTIFHRIRLEKTDATKIDAGAAIKGMAGTNDLKAANEEKDKEQQLKAYQDVLTDHEGKPITYAVSQHVISLLTARGAKPADFAGPIKVYLGQAELYGHEITVGANMVVGQMLTGYEKTKAEGLTYTKKAADTLTADDPHGLALAVYLSYVLSLEKNGKKDELKGVIEKYQKTAEATVKAAKDEADKLFRTQLVARLSLDSPNTDLQNVGVKYAEDVVKLLKDNDPPTKKMIAYETLAYGLERLGKKDAAKAWRDKLPALEEELDRAFEKANVPFELVKFDGRKGKGKRAALVELFTGAQFNDTVAAEVAFDAALRSYKPRDVIFLQYHLHVPVADALANADAEARALYYGDEVEGVPTMFIDGKLTPTMKGKRVHAEKRYESLRDLLDKAVEEQQEASIQLEVSRKGDQVDIKATVAELKKAGEKVRLRLVVVEDAARYTGLNGQRLHHHVVRAMPGGAKGFALKEGGTHQATFDVAAFRTAQNKYLDEVPKRPAPKGNPVQFQFYVSGRPVDLKKLKVVAFVQDDDSKKVYQAAQADVPEAKAEKKDKEK